MGNCKEGCDPFPCNWEPGQSDSNAREIIVNTYAQSIESISPNGWSSDYTIGIENSTGPQYATLDALHGASRVKLSSSEGIAHLGHGKSVLIRSGKLGVAVSAADRTSSVKLLFSQLPIHLHTPRVREVSIEAAYTTVVLPTIPAFSAKVGAVIIHATGSLLQAYGQADALVATELRAYQLVDAGGGTAQLGALIGAAVPIAAGALGQLTINSPTGPVYVVLVNTAGAGTGWLRVIGGFI